MTNRYKIHPAAEIFPMMTADEFKGLRDDIAQHGQREEVVVWRGQLVDGRNRLRACEELGKTPIVKHLERDADPWGYVVSHNLHRRHLTTSQRAMIAASIAGRENGANQHSKNKGQNCPPSIDAAAKSLKVSARSVKAAKQIQKHATEEIKQAVRDGRLTVCAASKRLKEPKSKRAKSAAVANANLETNPKQQSEPKPEHEIAKAFANLESNRLVALRKIFDDLRPHEIVALRDWIDDDNKRQNK